jgi:hypothetical protein
MKSTTQVGTATWAGQHAGCRNLVAAGRTIEPVLAIFALDFGKSLLFAAFGTLTIHLAVFDIVFEQQATAGTGFGVTIANDRSAIRHGADEYGLARAAPVFSFFYFFTNRTFFHGSN